MEEVKNILEIFVHPLIYLQGSKYATINKSLIFIAEIQTKYAYIFFK